MAKKAPAAPAADRGEKHHVTLVYIGRRAEGGFMWLKVPVGYMGNPAESVDWRGAWVWKKQLMAAIPGSVYTFQGYEWGDGHASMITAKFTDDSPVYLGNWKNEDERQEWLILDERARIARQLEMKAAQQQRERLPFKNLDVFNRVYQKSTPAQQAQLLALVIAHITEYHPPKPKKR